MPTFNIAEGKLSIHHSLKIKSKYTAAEESEGYRKGMGIQSMAIGDTHRYACWKAPFKEKTKDKGKSTKLEEVT